MEHELDGWEARIGELAVYPGQGVALVEGVERQQIAGEWLELIVLRKLEDQSKIMVPQSNVGEVGLRSLADASDCARVWELLAEPGRSPRRGLPWSQQLREYQETLRRGSIFALSEIVRDLVHLGTRKDLSVGERRVLESARALLVQELAAAEELAPEEVAARLQRTLGVATA